MDRSMREGGAAAVWDDESHLPGHVDIEVATARGSLITLASGETLLDAASGHSCVNLGYAHEELIEAGARSWRALSYCSPEHRCRPVEELSGRLSELMGGGYRVRYAATGGGANELAIEIARRYWRHRGRPGKRQVITLDRAYHGSTGLASFASGPGILQSPHADRSAEFRHAPGARDPAAGRSRPADAIEAGIAAEIAAAGADNVAALLVEPVAFAGGVIVPPEGFLDRLARLCREAGILLVVDEIITGFGRSGRWFAFQRAGTVKPDIVTLGKGITSAYFPLAAAVVREEIHAAFREPGNAMSKLVTMAGHPVGCDIALAVIAIMARDGLVERVARTEARLAALRRLEGTPGLREVRGLGLMWGLEFGEPWQAGAERARAVAARCRAAGVLVLQADNLIRINPPLTASEAEIARIVDVLTDAVTGPIRSGSS